MLVVGCSPDLRRRLEDMSLESQAVTFSFAPDLDAALTALRGVVPLAVLWAPEPQACGQWRPLWDWLAENPEVPLLILVPERRAAETVDAILERAHGALAAEGLDAAELEAALERAGRLAAQGPRGPAATKALMKSEERYRLVSQTLAHWAYVTRMHPDGRLEAVWVSQSFARLTGYFAEEMDISELWLRMIHPDDLPLFQRRLEAFRGRRQEVTEYRIFNRAGQVRWVRDHGRPVLDPSRQGAMLIYGAARDITAEKRDQEELLQKEAELKAKARDLEEANTALKVLLTHRGQEKEQVEESVLASVRRLVMPHLERLGRSGLGPRQVEMLELIRENLGSITRPLASRLTARHLGLTPREMEVANLVAAGRATSEIAALLGLSERGVKFHRNNIRAKLGLKDRRVNLKAYLGYLAKG